MNATTTKNMFAGCILQSSMY